MADFVQVMKDWRRMCKAYTTDDESCCEGCPVVDLHEPACGAIYEMDDNTDYQRYVDVITAWAAEHPEPVYPTWSEWLYEQGVLEDQVIPMPTINDDSSRVVVKNVATKKVDQRIPADIAQKLGIGPKEG